MHIAGFFRTTKLHFVEKKHESEDIYTFSFSPSRPLKHIAGQHGLFVLPRLRGLHIFSLSSAPEEQYVTLTTHLRKESRYKQHLKSLKSGDTMTLWGPVLDFIFKEDVTEYVFLAQGVGITPFRSLLVHAREAALKIKTTLIHVDGAEHTFKDLTKKLATRAYYPINPEEFTRNIKEAFNADALYYLSGSPRFISATKQTLRGLGIKRSQIKTDSFWGY